jgi:hypothetical protein
MPLPSDPSGISFFPTREKLRSLPPRLREQTLQGWVVWLDANRYRASRACERRLDRALRDLREDTVGHPASLRLEERFSEWLENAGEVGKGHGPDEEPEEV